MIQIEDKAKCSGCSACYSVCPKQCISMAEDAEGFRYPQVDTDLCINCGLCEKVCPILNPVPEVPFEQKAYLVQHQDDAIREDSASGGAFSAIAAWVINQGGVVFGAAYDQDFTVYHTYVETVEDLYRFRNSKYVQSVIGESFRQAKTLLEAGRWVCFSGTPCQIEGLSSYLRKPYERLILVDLACHSISSPLVWRKYLEYQNVAEVKPDNIRFRDKYYGYKYSTMSMIKDGKNIYHAGSQMDPMLRTFVNNMSARPSCYDCPFKKRYRVSDFTLWDCFSVYDFDKSMDDDKGTTRVLCHTDKAVQILNAIDQVKKKEVAPDQLVKGVKEMFHSVEPNPGREAFYEDACHMTGNELFNKYCRVTLGVKVKTAIRKFLVITGLYGTAKKCLNRVRGR